MCFRGPGESPHYNDRVNPATVQVLLDLNRQFYSLRGRDFADTRRRVQPGVRRVMKRLKGDEAVLDLGCGSGVFAAELSRDGHQGKYLGIDESDILLEVARAGRYGFPVQFVRANLAELTPASATVAQHADTPGAQVTPASNTDIIPDEHWSWVTAFAVLHHIPGRGLRVALLERVRRWLRPDGCFVISNWQFTVNKRLRAKIQPWSSIDATLDIDDGDFLLDWRRGGRAYRYVHEFSEAELRSLASDTGFSITDTFNSDGADGASGLYQVWQPIQAQVQAAVP